MNKAFLAISNQSFMLGGGEHSFLDFLTHLPPEWIPVAVLPQAGELENRLKRKGIQTVIIPLTALRPWKMYRILSNIIQFYRICKKIRPALIYANGSRAALYGGIAGYILNFPVVWHCRVATRDPCLDFFLKKLCARIVVNSAATAERFSKQGRSRADVIYNGLDISWLKSPEVKRPPWIKDEWKPILVVARVSKWKRHDIVLSAFESIAARDPNLHLICVGGKDKNESEWWDELQRRILRSKFSERVHWEGYCNDVRPWYRAASVFALASDNEPFGRVIVEAMANAVPVVAMNSGGVTEIVRHGKDGLLVEPGSSLEMANALIRLTKDRDLRERMGESAVQRAFEFSIDNHVEKMIRLFEDISGINKGQKGPYHSVQG